MKTCTKCKITKDASAFYRSHKEKDRLQAHCKDCAKAYKKEWNATEQGKAKRSVQNERYASRKRMKELNPVSVVVETIHNIEWIASNEQARKEWQKRAPYTIDTVK